MLFIDVEGFECEALRGATKTLAHGPDCYVEVHGGIGLEKFGGSVEAVLAYFPEDRYARFFATEGAQEFARPGPAVPAGGDPVLPRRDPPQRMSRGAPRATGPGS